MKRFKEWYFPDSEEHYQEHLLEIDGSYEYQKNKRDASLKHIKNKRTAIDIGANIGLWAKDLCKIFNKVILFEPYNVNIECLNKNLEQFNNYFIYDLALSNKSGYEDLYINDKLSGYSSFNKRDHIDQKLNPDSYLKPKKIKVKIIKLDDLDLQDIDYIKIDVQYHELEVIEGAITTLRNNNPVLCIESARRTKEELNYVKKFVKILFNLEYKIIGGIGKELFFRK